MKSYRFLLVVAFWATVIGFAVQAQTLYNGVGHIPAAYQERWNRAGLLQDMSTVEPKLLINVASLTGTDDQKVQAALNQARTHVQSTNGLAIVYFPTGTYTFTTTIPTVSSDRNIVFQGAGSDKTFLVFQNMKNLPCFNLSGSAPLFTSQSDLDQNFNKGDSIIHAANGQGLSGINSGDWIHLIKYDFDYQDPNAQIEKEIVGQITRLEAKGTDATGEWGEIKDVANMNYVDSSDPNYSLKVREVTPVQNIGIEDLAIKRNPEEQATAYVYNINFEFAVNCWVKGVESYKASRNHFKIGLSSHIEVSGCYFHEAMGYGDGGWGYGVETYASTTNCLIENNIFRKLRHAMVAGGGSNCNVWTFNYSREKENSQRDLDLHAKYPFGHLFEHNAIQVMASDDYHGDNGPYNAFVRNYAYDGNADFRTMEYWSTLGNIRSSNLLRALPHFYDEPAIMDRFGFWNGYTLYRTHNVAYATQDEGTAELLDVSYYYSARPSFLFPEYMYTWPAIGPKVSGATITQTIPAADRFSSSKKTYLPDPTPKPLTTSGTLAFDQTWPNGHTLTGNVIVPNNITLTIAVGATINFASGTSLTVNGSLVANSTDPNQRITFTGTSSTPGFWNGIKINSGSTSTTSTMRRCNVSYATTGVTITYTGSINSVTLDKCRISNNSSKGVYVNGNGYSTASVHPTLSSNHIHNNGSTGVTVSNYGKPLITGNQINYNSGYGIEATSSYTGEVSFNRVANNSWQGMLFYASSHALVNRNTVESNGSGGIYIFSNSNVTAAGGGTNQGRNEITGNTGTGVYANTSSPNFGISNGYNWMQSNTSYEAQMVGSSGYQLRAENCYWGGGAPAPSEISGNVDYSPHVTTLPNPIGWGQSDGHDPSYLVQPQPNPAIAMTPPQSFYPLMTSRATNGASNDWTRDLIDAINAGLATGDWSQASELITALHRELQDARVPAVEFALVNSYANRHDVASSIRKMLALVLVENDLVENKESAALARLNAFRQSNGEHAAEFWANTGLIHLYRQNDVASARNVLAQLQTLAQNGDNIAAEHVVVFGRMIEDYEEENRAGASLELQKSLAAQAHSLPSTPTLTQNYPNPFNPETSIRFNLNQSQNIRLAIYDVNGRHVRMLAAGEFSEGEHVVSWDGRNDQGRQVVSGIYFYELIAEDKVERKKMTVLR